MPKPRSGLAKALLKRKPVKTKIQRKPQAKAKGKPSRARVNEAAMAALAHEIRTPLTGILAMSELLSSTDLPARERSWVLALKSAAEHLSAFTTLIVDGTGATRQKLRVETFNPRLLIHSLGANLMARAEAKKLKSKIRIDTSLPDNARGDPIRLRAALENLIDNAVKFTEQGEVVLVCKAEAAGEGQCRLIATITDTGIGMTDRERKTLFRAFSQASRDIAERFGGAGLGLAYVRRAAKAMGGDVSVESVKGRGSAFTLTVMLQKASAAKLAKNRSKTPLRTTRQLSILAVEDNPYGRVALNAMLGAFGHGVTFAGTGEAALEAIDKATYDLILMDVVLPGISGIETTRRIRALPGAANALRIIGISAHGGAKEEAAARAAGMDDFLTKPVSAEALAIAIAQFEKAAAIS